MTEPLKVDTDELDAASAILKSAAGQIPTQLPQFSVNGSDPLSAAIAAGSAQIEAPMAALPWINANATTTAENIGVAGQRYRETDETLAQKAKEQQFDKDGDAMTPAPGSGNAIHAVDYKTSPPTDPEPPVPPVIQKQLDEQAKQIAEQGKQITEQGKQIAEQASSDGWTIDGAAEAAATGAATSVSALYLGQLFWDPLKPPEVMNSALLYGAGTVGAVTGFGIYTLGKGAKGIVKDIVDDLG